ncbi:MAG: DNRLRE domain-containing protein, partial [Actinomycetota bacterium]|nr:DNRLRE domain-containing protein [Actinomycetota bacterium]
RHWLAFALRGASGEARADGAKARYENALPGVDVVYTAQFGTVKEDLVLRGPSSQRSFSFDVTASRGLRPDALQSGAIALRDKVGRIRLSMSAPFMVDAKRRVAPVRPRIARVEGAWRLTYALDDEWLDDPRRAWPVTVDPEVYPGSPNGGDCYLDASFPESSFCAANPMKVGMVGGHDHNVVMRFPLAAIPKGAEVAGATLVAWATGDQSTTAYPDVEVQPLTEAFTSAASWNRTNGTERWSEPGGEADASARAEFPGWVGNGTHYASMLKVVREWVAGTRPNHGLLLSVPAGTDGFWLDSNESTTNRPYLHVVIKERIGDRRGWVHERQQLNDRMSLGVNVGSGNLMVQATDFTMPGGLGPAVSVSRSYNSLDDSFDSLGSWQMDTGPDFHLEQQAGGNYMRLVFPSGAKGIYDRNQDGSYKTPPGFNNTLQRDVPAAGKWQLTDHASQAKYRFENYTKNGRLYEIEDRNGRKLTFVYDATTNKLVRIEDSNNDATVTTDDVRFTFSGAYATQMTDPAGRVHTYGYTGNYLTSYTDPQNGASFKTLFEYNGTGGRMSKITTPQGNVTTIDYYPAGHEYEGKVKSVTRVTDTTTMTGPTTSFEYMMRRDGSGETRVTDPIGNSTVDDNDRVARYVFDELGRVTETIEEHGHRTSRTFTSNSNVQTYTAAGSGTTGTTPNTSFGYDADDNATRTDTPVGGGSIRDCADFGSPDPAPGSTQDPSTEACDQAPAGYAGVPSAVSGSRYLLGRETNPQGGRTNYRWQPPSGTDNNGNLYRVEQTTNGGSLLAGTAFTRGNGADGKPGQLNAVTDHRGNTTTYGYTDGKGNVNTITPPNPGTPNPTGVTDLVYNTNLARLDRMIVPNESGGIRQRRNMVYDNLDRLVRINYTGTNDVLDSGEPYVQYTFDRDGNLTGEETREQGTNTIRTRTMGYDKLNRLISETLPGASNTYTYDASGNLRTLNDGSGTVEYAYNAHNEVRAVYEPGTAKPTKFEHSENGQRTRTTYPNGVVVSQDYDQAFRLTQIHARNAAGTTLQKFDYAYQEPASGRQTQMIFQKTDGVLGHATRYGYDALDRLTSATIKSSTGDWATNTTLARYDYALDGVGNVTTRTVSGTQAPASTTGYTYNSYDQLCHRQAGAPAASCPTTTPAYTYDRNGNQLTAPGRTAAYNALDQTTSISGTALIYLGAGQDRWITEGSGTVQHNALGTGKRTVGTTTESFTRDDTGQLVSRRNGTTRHYYLFDGLGSVTGLTNSSGAVSQRHDYDPYGAPAPNALGQWGSGSSDVANGQFGFAGGYRSVNGLYHFGQRYYDPADMRWTQPDPVDQTGDLRDGSRYLYASANPVNAVDPDGCFVHGKIKKILKAAKCIASCGVVGNIANCADECVQCAVFRSPPVCIKCAACVGPRIYRCIRECARSLR